MNTEVNFEIAKLLKEKGFDELTFYYYSNKGDLCEPYEENGSSSDVQFRVDLTDLLDNHNCPYLKIYSAPTIAQVIMWLYERHGIWITVLKHRNESKEGFVAYNNDKVIDDKIFFKLHSSPTEAYLEAINYTLNNLI